MPDPNVLAFSIVQQVTGEPPTPAQPEPLTGKNPAAVALGKLGGLKGGPARARALPAKKRSQIAKMAAQVRWRGKKLKSEIVK